MLAEINSNLETRKVATLTLSNWKTKIISVNPLPLFDHTGGNAYQNPNMLPIVGRVLCNVVLNWAYDLQLLCTLLQNIFQAKCFFQMNNTWQKVDASRPSVYEKFDEICFTWNFIGKINWGSGR